MLLYTSSFRAMSTVSNAGYMMVSLRPVGSTVDSTTVLLSSSTPFSTAWIPIEASLSAGNHGLWFPSLTGVVNPDLSRFASLFFWAQPPPRHLYHQCLQAVYIAGEDGNLLHSFHSLYFVFSHSFFRDYSFTFSLHSFSVSLPRSDCDRVFKELRKDFAIRENEKENGEWEAMK